MKKEIYFCVDYNTYQNLCDILDGSKWCSIDYDSTERIIGKVNRIVTTSLAHLTFDVINMGYDVYLCYKDKKVKIEEGMQLSESGYCLSEPLCCEDDDILDIFKRGYFDEMLGYDTER